MKKEDQNANNQSFDNRTFWDRRYKENPNLGSGIGSRGKNMMHKREFINQYLNAIQPSSILDIGCGDHEVLSGITFDASYHGIDISSEVITMNTNKYADRKFTCVNFANLEDVSGYKSDIIFCLEVLIHQHKKSDYIKLLTNAFRAARIGGLISGYVSNPRPVVQSDIIAWHEPVTETLKNIGANNISVFEYSLESRCLAFVSFSAQG